MAAVLVVYGLGFPYARVGFLFAVFPIVWPIWLGLGLWLTMQMLNWIGTFAGMPASTAFAAHLGGAAAGLVAWMAPQPTR